MKETVNHPSHYGGAENPYEHIKVVEAWGLGYALGNATKYIARAGRKTEDPLEDLRKARWYLDWEIRRLEGRWMETAPDVMKAERLPPRTPDIRKG